ncbi:hydrogenase maturation protease [Methylotuvimicrobium buryatense]|uniref:Hydrogenase maturation protease n=1 Tax=Methylotuvimicrobium buryatense TaxID=95641 RepID=A0A4P9UPV1_METBY|nr:hydrogenase maturation protease [Methylotuvimicrobium buryatense]QCW82271.1 hydrogenase maturation protease [Methylotuvimicrobium buryatense]
MNKNLPILIFGYGNLSRGDDALGPLLLEMIQERMTTGSVEILNDFQLQVEHALDLEDRNLVLFIDASVACAGAFDFKELKPAHDKSYTTHAMSPAAVLQVYQTIKHQNPPPCFLLSIQGEQFELGSDLSSKARENLQRAGHYAEQLLKQPNVDAWRKLAEKALLGTSTK